LADSDLGQVLAVMGVGNAKMMVKAWFKVLNKIIRHVLEGHGCVHDFIEGFGVQWKALWSQKRENGRSSPM
jgi:hypothetical protein